MTAGPLPPASFAERLAATSERARALYRAVLPTFAATGTPPPLQAAAARAGMTAEQADAALRELAAAEVVAVDHVGALVGAFPLSATATRHQARAALARRGMTGDVLAVADVHALGVALFADLPAR